MRYNFLLALLLSVSLGFAQQKYYQNELGFKSDNDAYLATKQDRYYTNGLFISYKHALTAGKDTNTKKIWSISAGQEMFNAQAGRISEIEYVDRPFAAYLYLGGSMQWLKSNENSIKAELQVGTIGPAALGKEVQTFLHKTVGFYEISGWEFQLNNEVGINSVINLHYLLARSKSEGIDISLPIKANLGTTYTGLGLSTLIRIGELNPFYHSVATLSNVATKAENNVADSELYFYLKPTLNYVAYNATIQGGLFRDDKGPVFYEAKPFVFSQELGVAFAKNRWTANFSLVFRSKEIETMQKSQQYGSVDLYYRF